MLGALRFILFFLIGYLLSAALRAEEKACHAEGATVVCTRDGFDTLVGKYIDQKSAAEKCVLRAESSTSEAKVLEARLALALAERDSARDQLPTFKPQTIFATGIVLGLVSAATITWLVK